MEGRIWAIILAFLPHPGKKPPRCQHDDRTILMVLLWACLHDRPTCWACQNENWPYDKRPARLPSPSTVSRRVRRTDWAGLLHQIHQQVILCLGFYSRYAALDAKPLPVGGGSKDPDARAGRAVGHMAKGYKLFALVAAGKIIAAFQVGAMCASEPRMARELLAQASEALTRVVAHGAYDSMPLHSVAARHGRRLYTPIRQNRVGRRGQPRRVRLLALWQTRVGQRLLASRDEVERTFARMGNIACGFKGLPNWVRRTHRVFQWMWGKVLIYHAYLMELATQMPQAA